MTLSRLSKFAFLPMSVLLFAVTGQSHAQSQTPILDAVANKVIQKYQTSTCQQLRAEKAQKAPPSPQEQKAIAYLKSDPAMRARFLNKVAAPIANKMFECGMIP
jgi:hypothetical protein